MIQEIVTYLIVLVAIYLAIKMMVAKLRKKKQPAKSKTGQQLLSMGHNCSDCSAECVLRDATTSYIKYNKELCQKVETKKEISNQL